MNSLEIKAEIRKLLSEANPKAVIANDESNLFDPSSHIMAVDMLFVCMELKKKYPIDYNKIVDKVSVYSLDNLSEAICAQFT